jgi:Zn-finger nucleic acid-binding protein
MDAATLDCPKCGAAIASTETVCRYCHARLATISCPQCFGLMFAGSKFCPHCGARAEQPIDIGPALPCPSCGTKMAHLLVQRTSLQECPRCYGIWVDCETFNRICADTEKVADVFDAERLPPARIAPGPVRYRPCPVCGDLMNRFNFERISGVIIDRCAEHGIWFDRDELRRIIDFIHSGGAELSRQRDLTEARRQQHEEDERAIRGKPPASSAFSGGFDNVGEIFREIKRRL